MFLRKKIISDGFYFNDKLKVIGDEEFVIRLLRHCYRAKHIKTYLAAFVITGNNMSNSYEAELERTNRSDKMPRWIRILKYPLNILRLTEKFLSGAYFEKMPVEYSVYASADAVARTTFSVSKASFRWPNA